MAPVATPPASDRVRAEWRNRIAAEYGSAAITQHFVLWLIQIGASPDLIELGLAIVADELAHSQRSAEVYVAAGGAAPPALDRATLALPRRADRPLEDDVITAALQVFCLNETVAVPLFAHLRAAATVPVARAALDRILQDEVRHRDFGWACLDWVLTTPLAAALPGLAAAELPRLFAALTASYGGALDAPSAVTDDDRAWGLAPARDYARILTATWARDYAPRFEARGIAAAAACAARDPSIAAAID
ncbi:MAG: ferritin-like domain-containing protein [Myxococcales bacterium]|nr:ferritin-like domain-containing protein [Myxococcales bacterium]